MFDKFEFTFNLQGRGGTQLHILSLTVGGTGDPKHPSVNILLSEYEIFVEKTAVMGETVDFRAYYGN